MNMFPFFLSDRRNFRIYNLSMDVWMIVDKQYQFSANW